MSFSLLSLQSRQPRHPTLCYAMPSKKQKKEGFLIQLLHRPPATIDDGSGDVDKLEALISRDAFLLSIWVSFFDFASRGRSKGFGCLFISKRETSLHLFFPAQNSFPPLAASALTSRCEERKEKRN